MLSEGSIGLHHKIRTNAIHQGIKQTAEPNRVGQQTKQRQTRRQRGHKRQHEVPFHHPQQSAFVIDLALSLQHLGPLRLLHQMQQRHDEDIEEDDAVQRVDHGGNRQEHQFGGVVAKDAKGETGAVLEGSQRDGGPKECGADEVAEPVQQHVDREDHVEDDAFSAAHQVLAVGHLGALDEEQVHDVLATAQCGEARHDAVALAVVSRVRNGMHGEAEQAADDTEEVDDDEQDESWTVLDVVDCVLLVFGANLQDEQNDAADRTQQDAC